MSGKFKLVLAAACGAALMAGGVAYAGSATSNGVRLAAPVMAPHTAQAGVTVQTEYVPITPCRIVDTRDSTHGILKANVAQAFAVGGTAGFTAQGGKSGGCGIPQSATAIATNLTATILGGTGVIQAWPRGAARPTAIVLAFNPAMHGITVGATLTVNPASTTGLLVESLRANTHFVIDVDGYYREPITATINSDGTSTTHSSQVTSTGRNPGNSTGVYVMNFDQKITGCSVNAIPMTTSTLLITALNTGDTSLLIIVRNPSNSSLLDSTVSVTLTC